VTESTAGSGKSRSHGGRERSAICAQRPIDHRQTMAAFLVTDEQSREPTARFHAGERRQGEPFRIALFDRGHGLAGYPGEGGDFPLEGRRLGRGSAVLQGVPIALGSSAGGSEQYAPHRRRAALQTAPLRFGVDRRARRMSKSVGLFLRFFVRPSPGLEIGVADDRLPTFGVLGEPLRHGAQRPNARIPPRVC
jgi:hypothetical protein